MQMVNFAPSRMLPLNVAFIRGRDLKIGIAIELVQPRKLRYTKIDRAGSSQLMISQDTLCPIAVVPRKVRNLMDFHPNREIIRTLKNGIATIAAIVINRQSLFYSH